MLAVLVLALKACSLSFGNTHIVPLRVNSKSARVGELLTQVVSIKKDGHENLLKLGSFTIENKVKVFSSSYIAVNVNNSDYVDLRVQFTFLDKIGLNEKLILVNKENYFKFHFIGWNVIKDITRGTNLLFNFEVTKKTTNNYLYVLISIFSFLLFFFCVKIFRFFLFKYRRNKFYLKLKKLESQEDYLFFYNNRKSLIPWGEFNAVTDLLVNIKKFALLSSWSEENLSSIKQEKQLALKKIEEG